MLKKTVYLLIIPLLCSSCVSRTIVKDPSLKDPSGKRSSESKLIWFWDKDFNQP